LLQLFGPLQEFLEAAGLLHEFELIKTVGSRMELVLRQQQQQRDMTTLPPPSMHCNMASNAHAREQTGMWPATAEGLGAMPSAAADADDAQALLLARAAASMQQLCMDSGTRLVQLQAWWELVRSSDIYLLLGGNAAAAVRFLQWPNVFVVEQDPAAAAAAVSSTAPLKSVQDQAVIYRARRLM
jgi:hypothetical protein